MFVPSCYFALVAFVSIFLIAPLHAAEPTEEQLKSWIGIRQQRVELLRDETKQIDERIESRLDMIVERLTSITDSKDSVSKVARMKEETMKRLMKTIESYQQKRATIREDLRNRQTLLTDEEKRRLITVFDERIEKRVQQILALNKSMPAHQDYERYKATGSNWYGTTYERNADYEQNQKMTTHSNAQRDAILKQLDDSIARLDRMGRALRTQLAATTDPAQQKERAADMARNDALIAERRKEKSEVSQPSDKVQRGVALKEAMDLDRNLQKAIDELSRDFTTLFQRYHSYVSELITLHATEAALAAKTGH